MTLYDASRQDALDGCLALADRYEAYFSDTIADSDVSRINAHPGEPVTVHDETAQLIQKGLDYAAQSNGRFDITIGKLAALWRFSDVEDGDGDAEDGSSDGDEDTSGDSTDDAGTGISSTAPLPAPATIAAALSGVDYHKVTVDGNTVTLADASCAIDLGGIAKGYIADQMKAYLQDEGITAGLINLGGNVLVLGDKPNGDAYTIGIQKPFAADGTPILSVDVRGASVVTSGTYQRYIELDGHIYHHIIDTDTGYPCDNGLASVTIIGASSVDGDALSTSVFLMGLEDGLSYVESLPDTEAVFVTDDNELVYSSGMGTTVPYQAL